MKTLMESQIHTELSQLGFKPAASLKWGENVNLLLCCSESTREDSANLCTHFQKHVFKIRSWIKNKRAHQQINSNFVYSLKKLLTSYILHILKNILSPSVAVLHIIKKILVNNNNYNNINNNNNSNFKILPHWK